MTYLKWTALAVADLLMLVAAVALSPILPAFAIGRTTLPTWLSWFQTPDNRLDGDCGYQTQHAPFAGPQTGWKQYVNRIGWLLRNPSYGFDIAVLGLTVRTAVTTKGTIPLGGSPAISGWFLATCAGGFQFYAIKYWRNGRASRIDFGWKLWSAPGACQFAMTVSPYFSI